MIEVSKNNKSRSVDLKSGSFQKYVLFTFIFFISLLSFRCANMQTPTGGPKDSIPPVILNEKPQNYMRNFDAKEIVLQFDEYIKLNNQFKEFSISPDVEKQPEYKIKKKFLHIILPDSLEENTTYTINFGKGLTDYNEGNPILNYTYVFATGPELDSLTLSGRVKDAYKKSFDPKEDLDVRVLLIPTKQDSIFGKKKANIFTSVDSSGNFQFKNLREDTYRIYAIKEQNNDRIYNNPNESIGFIVDSIVLNQNISDIKIEYSKGLPTDFKILERKIEKDGRILLGFNQPLDSPTIHIIHPTDLDANKIIRYSAIKDSATIFVDKIEFDSIKFEISNYNNILDTTMLRRNKNDKYERIIVPTANINNKVDKVNHIQLTSNMIIQSANKEKFILKEDSVSRRNFQLQRDTINTNKYFVRFNWKPNKSYELILEENALTGPFEEFNKEFKLNFTLDDTDNFGDIKFKINDLDSNTNYIVQLIDENKTKVFDTKILINTNELNYIKYPGGKYTLRIIKDLNKNGRWDGVDVFKRVQAEPIWYLDKPFTIRANWEQSETITPQFE